MSCQWGQTECDVLSVGADRVMSCQWGQTGCDVLSVGEDRV